MVGAGLTALSKELLDKVEGLEKAVNDKQLLLEQQMDMSSMYHQRSREDRAELVKLQQHMVSLNSAVKPSIIPVAASRY
jgi:hypothetical protein